MLAQIRRRRSGGRDPDHEAALFLDRSLEAVACQETRCRRVFGELARVFRERRAYLALGFVRLSDYARERLGRSGSEVATAARVAAGLSRLRAVASALDCREISWTKARLLVAVATEESESRWLAAARRVTTRELEEMIRRDADPSGKSMAGRAAQQEVEALREEDGKEIEGEPRLRLRILCPGSTWLLFRRAVEFARRMSGEEVAVWKAAEAIAAEGISGTPREVEAESPEVTASLESTRAKRTSFSADRGSAALPWIAPTVEPAQNEQNEQNEQDDRAAEVARYLRLEPEDLREALPTDPAPLALGAEALDPVELDRRMREIVSLLQQIDWRMGKLLDLLFGRRLESTLGITSLDRYAGERLGMSVRKARCLLALARRAERQPALGRAYREGDLSWLRSLTLMPVLGDARLSESDESAAAWVERAQSVTVRRLSAEVDWALEQKAALGSDTLEPPPLGARLEPVPLPVQMRDGEIDERKAAPLFRIEFSGPASVISLFRAAIFAWTERSEPPWRGLERLLRHALGEWERQGKHRDPIFERDGWRCAVPACSSRRNLHDHHKVFRSHGGSNARENRIATCAAHHLHGIHEGRIRVSGELADGLLWELGTNRDGTPFLRFRGEVYASAVGAAHLSAREDSGRLKAASGDPGGMPR